MLARPALVVEGNDPFDRSRQVGDDEADALLPFAVDDEAVENGSRPWIRLRLSLRLRQSLHGNPDSMGPKFTFQFWRQPVRLL